MMREKKRKNRSDFYQYLLLETACSHEMLSAFSNADSISNRLNPFEYNEELLELEDQLKVEFWRIVETLLTPRQKQVIRMYADGYTQMEIAKALGVNQSSVTKNIRGNAIYANPININQIDPNHNQPKSKAYGGSKRKLRKIIETDPKIVSILKRMQEIRDLKW